MILTLEQWTQFSITLMSAVYEILSVEFFKVDILDYVWGVAVWHLWGAYVVGHYFIYFIQRYYGFDGMDEDVRVAYGGHKGRDHTDYIR